MALASVGASPGVTQQQEALASAAGEDFIICISGNPCCDKYIYFVRRPPDSPSA
jgi:hypothetical protein